MPEIFLKACSIARNVGISLQNIITSNFDMLQNYRPINNVINRPTANNGKGYIFTGHHEIMLPLLAACLYEYEEVFI